VVCFVCVGGACGAMVRFLQIAAQLEISHVDYPVIASQPKACWVLQIPIFVHRAIEATQKP